MNTNEQRVFTLWLSGYADHDIANLLSISRQRVFQIRNSLILEWALANSISLDSITRLRVLYARAYGNDYLRISQAAREVGISSGPIQNWIELNWIRPSPSKFVRLREIQTIKKRLIDRPCNLPECREPIGLIHLRARFCFEHR